jgi:hypothetical protein
MNSLDIGKPNGRVVGFCGRGKDWPEPDVIGASRCADSACLRLVDFPTNNSRPFLPHDLDRIIFLPDVHTFHRSFGDLGVVVYNQRRRRSRRQSVELGRKLDKFVDGPLFSAQLNQINTTLDHRFSDGNDIRVIDVTEIQDAVEPAFA